MIRDLRYAIRGLLGNPGFAAVAILTIGLGIGANTVIFSWMRNVLLNPLPAASDPDHIVAIENTADNGDPLSTSFLDYTDYRDHLQLVDSVTLKKIQPFVVGEEARPERVWGEMVSGNFFDLLGVRPEIGRFFNREESGDEQNAHSVAVISHAYWISHYHGQSSVIGAKLRLNRTVFTIIGVAPKSFRGSWAGLGMQIWVPITMYGEVTHTGTWMLRDRNTRNFTVLARLKPGVTIEQARSETKALADLLAKADADSDQGVGADVLPLWKSHFGSENILLTPIAILVGASGLMLLIVCANVANLLLARVTARRKEFSVRMALGATTAHLTRELLTEALLVALAGSLVGLLIASWLGGSLAWLIPAVSTPMLLQPPLDAKVLLYSTALACFVALAAGCAPALNASRVNVNEVLKEGARGSTGSESHRLRGLLVVAEVTLAVVALICAGLFLKNFQKARGMNPGFDPDGVVLAQFDFSTAGYSAQQTDTFCQRLRERLEQTAAVTAVSYDDTVPLGFGGGNWEALEIEGYVPPPGERMKIYRDMVAPGFFSLMRIPLLEGRDFDLRDSATKLHDDPIQKVMIVNQEFVRRYFGSRNPLGHKVRGWGEWFTIVGVVHDAKYHQVTESPQPYFYIPIRQVYRPEYGLTFLVRTSGPVTQAISAIRREAAAIDPELLVADAEPMTEYTSASLFGQKITASLLSVLGGLSLLLAAGGLYSVMAYSVAQRTNEIGIRVTLGARPGQVMSLILRQAMKLALVGLVLGSAMAAAAARLISAALAAVSPADPIVYLGAAAFASLIALLAAAIPAWRALRVDPMVALRYQ
jgi:predicted permease